jgi:hypothetical protein
MKNKKKKKKTTKNQQPTSGIFFSEKLAFHTPHIRGTPPKFARHTSVRIDNKIFVFGGFNGHSTYYSLAVFNLGEHSHKASHSFSISFGFFLVGKFFSIDLLSFFLQCFFENRYASMEKQSRVSRNTTTSPNKVRPLFTLGSHVFCLLIVDFFFFFFIVLLVFSHCAVAVGKCMYIYGGNYTIGPEDSYTILGDLHVLDTETMTWKEIITKGDNPGPRTAHSMISIGTAETNARKKEAFLSLSFFCILFLS